MLVIKRIAFYENGTVSEIEFDEHPDATAVAEFCAKYKIGWQSFKPEFQLKDKEADSLGYQVAKTIRENGKS